MPRPIEGDIGGGRRASITVPNGDDVFNIPLHTERIATDTLNAIRMASLGGGGGGGGALRTWRDHRPLPGTATTPLSIKKSDEWKLMSDHVAVPAWNVGAFVLLRAMHTFEAKGVSGTGNKVALQFARVGTTGKIDRSGQQDYFIARDSVFNISHAWLWDNTGSDGSFAASYNVEARVIAGEMTATFTKRQIDIFFLERNPTDVSASSKSLRGEDGAPLNDYWEAPSLYESVQPDGEVKFYRTNLAWLNAQPDKPDPAMVGPGTAAVALGDGTTARWTGTTWVANP